MKRILIIILAFAFSLTLNAQRIVGAGAGTLYNFQANGIGVEARLVTNLYSSLYLSPRISYFPKFNHINELYAGADLSWIFPKIKKKYSPYIFTGAYYNNWINSSTFSSKEATKNNIGIEPGLGLLFNYHCINPYLESRYDLKWKEFYLGVGVIFKFGDCFGKNGFFIMKTSKGRKNANKCPNF